MFPFTSGTRDVYFHSKKQNLPTHQYNCFFIAPKSWFLLLLCFFALDGSRAGNGCHVAGANNNPTGKRDSRREEFEKLSVSALKAFFFFFKLTAVPDLVPVNHQNVTKREAECLLGDLKQML